MNEETDPSRDNASSDQNRADAEQKRLRESIPGIIENQSAKETEQAANHPPKQSLFIRGWRALYRRRHWRTMAGHPRANVAEKLTVFITICILIVGAIQAFIYWKQAQVMERTLEQTERSVILGRGQVAIADRNATTAGDTLAQMKKDFSANQGNFRLLEQPYLKIGRQDGVIAEFKDSEYQSLDMILYLQNIGHLPANNVCVWIRSQFSGAGLPAEPLRAGGSQLLTRMPQRHHFGTISYVAESLCPAIGGESAAEEHIGDVFRKDMLNKFIKEYRVGEASLQIDAVIQYCDPFNHYVCQQASFNYGKDAIRPLELLWVRSCGKWPPPILAKQIHGEIQLMTSVGKPSLYPCPTPEQAEVDRKQQERADKEENDALNPPPK
jgi:hypothetical protein